MKPRKYVRHTSTARAKQLREYRRDVALFLDCETRCACCGIVVSRANRTNHHRYGKVGRLLNWKPGWSMVGIGCHCWITDHPQEARKMGLIGPEGTWNDFNRAVAHYEANK